MDTTSLWLHNKLGTSNDSSWTSGSICSQLNKEVLKNIKECFPDLQTQVKLKLLLSFFHIPRRLVEEWKKELEEIIEVAGIDSELWVSMIAETMKTFPATGSLNTEISDYDETRPIFTDMVNDLRRLVNRHTDLSMLPLECQYLNKTAFISVVGQQPQTAKHFTLKRKPKSVQLRAELLQKSVDAQSTLKKASAPTIPLRSRGMPRKMTDTTPLKGIPSRMPTSGGFRSPTTPGAAHRPNLSRTPAGRKEGGVKLIDFSEAPIALATAKRRKKQEAEEAQKKAVAEAAEQAAAAAASSAAGASGVATSGAAGATPQLANAVKLSPTNNNNNSATPDYAAGLTASTIYTQPATPAPVTKSENGPKGGSKPLPPLVPVNSSGNHDLSSENDIEMVDEEDEAMDGSPMAAVGGDEEPVEEDDGDEEDEEEVADDAEMEEDEEEAQQQQQQQPQTVQHIVQPQQLHTQHIVTNNLGQIKLQTAQGTTPSGLIIKTIDPNSVQQQQRLPFNQIFSQQAGGGQNTIISPATSQITMPAGLTVLSTTAGGSAMDGSGTKIVQIKTAPTTYMMSPHSSANAPPPPLIATQQQMSMAGKKTVLVTSTGQHQQQLTGNASNMVFVTSNPGQAQQQIITNAAGQRFVMTTPQKIGVQAAPTTANLVQAQGQQGNKPIILSNQSISGASKGVIIRSIGPTGAPVYQQIPLSSVTRLQSIAGGMQGAQAGTYLTTTNQGMTLIQKKPDLPALVPTSGGTIMVQQQPQQQQQATLITATRNQQPRAPGTTIIRPVLGSNVQQLQGYTIVQRGGPGQPTLIQAIPQQQKQQQQPQQLQVQQQVQRIITQQPVAQQLIQQQQQQQPQQRRQILIQQPAKKGLTLAPEHAHKVTEMFRCANKVTRLDKALILSFIAGQTENPRPNAENVLNITLNQSKEKVRQEDKTDALMLVESVIRLDYNTMEYKTFQRYHRLDQATSAGGADDTNNNSKVAIKMTQVKSRATLDKSGL